MKTLSIVLAFLVCVTTGTVSAQQKFLAPEAEESGPVARVYTGSHGPFYNGTVSDPTIPPRSAVPAGSLKGIKRNFTNKVIEGEAGKNQQLMIGDDMQTAPKGKAVSARKKSKYEQTVW
jgi:hypothetical protein